MRAIPTYDVECSGCGHEVVESIKLADLAGWDKDATCPACGAAADGYRRVIKQAPGVAGCAKANLRSAAAHKTELKERFVRSGERDAMMQKHAKVHDADRVAEAKDNVKKGRFENF